MASNYGRIKSLDRVVIKSNGVSQLKHGKIINGILNNDGYLQCKLCKDGKYKTVRMHRIIAQTFIDNPNNLPEVNHKDCNRQNNYVENLEWVSHLENIQHSTKLGHYKKPCGEQNPNYRNTKLKEYFALHPEEKKKLSRPGQQNGRAHPIYMKINNDSLYFSYIGECVKYLIKNDIVTNVKYDSLHSIILKKLNTGKEYRGLTFYDI